VTVALSGAPRILVVEHNAEMRRFISGALAPEYNLDTATDGAQGLAAVLSARPELVITDVTLPGLSGDQLISEVRKHHDLDATPILVLTASSQNDEELCARVLSEGAQDYLDKPFSTRELRARVRNLIALQRARALLVGTASTAAIFDVALDGIVSMNHKGVVTGFNGAAEQMFGYARNEALGRPLAELIIPPSLREAHQEGLARYLASGEGAIVGKRVTLSAMRKDGTEFPIELSVLRVPNVDPPAFAGFIRDMTGAKRTSKKSSPDPLVLSRELQRKAEQHFRELIDAAPDALLIVDRRGKILEANRPIEELFGHTRAELVGKEIELLVPAAFRDKHRADLAAYLRAPHPRTKGSGLQLRGVRKDGTEVTVEVRLRPIEMDAGHVVVAAIHDLSDRMRAQHAEQELVQEQTARATAEENVRIRDDFLAVAGHELKTPLAAMMTQIQGLLRGERQNQVGNIAERIDNLGRSGVRLELIQQLLDVSRITAGRLRLEPTPCDLSELARQVVDRFVDVAAYANCPLSFHAREHVEGMWDRLRLEAVVASLLSNAIRFGRGKPVEIEVTKESAQAILKVTDRGIGIDRDHRQRLLQRFERAIGAHEYGGFGLGLWISRNIVEASGGTINVESAPNRGSTFTVRLPIASGE
jgi:protein-histidine pros-kinase